VHHAQGQCAAARQSREVQQAGGVRGGEDLGARAAVVVDPVVPHQTGDGRLLHREGTSEAAALVRAPQRRDVDAFDRLEQLPRRIGPHGLDALARGPLPQLAQAVAARMQADAVGEAPRDLADPEHVYQEPAQLVGPALQQRGLRRGAQQRAVAPHRRDAARRRTHDVVVGGEDLDEAPRQGLRLPRPPTVQQRLTAAGLGRRKVDRHAEALEQLEARDSRPGPELIHVAGHEQTDAHGAPDRRGERSWAVAPRSLGAEAARAPVVVPRPAGPGWAADRCPGPLGELAEGWCLASRTRFRTGGADPGLWQGSPSERCSAPSTRCHAATGP
jgi:hypothetical protein